MGLGDSKDKGLSRLTSSWGLCSHRVPCSPRVTIVPMSPRAPGAFLFSVIVVRPER